MKKITFLLMALMSSFIMSGRGKEVAIVAHRGYWNCEQAGKAKNSVAALKQAQDLGFWGSEFDVNMTSDGVLLVFHDNNVEGKRIEKHPYSEFAECRIANGEKIPTIDDYFEQAKKNPDMMLVYELKNHSSKEVETRAVEASIAKIKEHGLYDPEKVMFIAFSKHVCKEFARLAPGFSVQYLGGDVDSDIIKDMKAAGVDGIDTNQKVLLGDKKIYKEARRQKMMVNTWTVNKEDAMRQLIEMGVDFITTDNPELLRQVLQDMGVAEKKAK